MCVRVCLYMYVCGFSLLFLLLGLLLLLLQFCFSCFCFVVVVVLYMCVVVLFVLDFVCGGWGPRGEGGLRCDDCCACANMHKVINV